MGILDCLQAYKKAVISISIILLFLFVYLELDKFASVGISILERVQDKASKTRPSSLKDPYFTNLTLGNSEKVSKSRKTPILSKAKKNHFLSKI